MKNEKSTAINPVVQHENKVRIPVWLYPATIEAIDRNMKLANCRSRSEYLEEAAQFYAGYYSGQDALHYLPPMLVEALRGTVHDTENRLARLLFKLAVETDMMMNVLAEGFEINPNMLRDLRGRCVENVKRTSGRVTFDDAVAAQSE